ncbi:MAG: HEPN domain protein [candidate division TM6 bacterium GW2011_GWF2_43_87]|nr:MAG: HEPN domain protein [candidate division TM6 bacterium GW2011_GWF2_43_87]
MYGVERWLVIAKTDLLSARHLLKGEFYAAATFYCQQSAEKALKGFMTFYKLPLVKTHDLVGLLTICCDKDQSFDKLLNSAEYLNPFSTKFRYLSEYDIPDEKEAVEAVDHAQRILIFVNRKTKISEDLGQQGVF